MMSRSGLPALLGEDGEGVRVPLDQELALLHFLAILHLQLGAVDDRVALALPAVPVVDDQRPARAGGDATAGGLPRWPPRRRSRDEAQKATRVADPLSGLLAPRAQAL